MMRHPGDEGKGEGRVTPPRSSIERWHRARNRAMGASSCPDRTELEGFVVGSLPGPAFARVVDHVARCEACEAALQALDRVVDPLLSQLRRLSGTDAPEDDPMPVELLAA